MFINGVYSEAEQKLIDDYIEYGKKSAGWLSDEFDPEYGTQVTFRKATKSILTLVARSHDPKNPMFRNESYAHQSRWGTVIAPPMFTECIGQGPGCDLQIPPEIGAFRASQFGQDFKWIKPIKLGDELRVYHLPNRLEDNTPPGEQEERILTIHETDYQYNQNDELIAVYDHLRHKIYAEPGTADDGNMRAGFGMDHGGRNEQYIGKTRWTKPYVYTPEQIAAIDEIYANEPIRGKETRWWEDVEIGEELPVTILGPITVWDCMGALATHNEATLNMNEVRTRKFTLPLFEDPETLVTHRGVEIHLDPDVCKLIGWYSHSIVDNMINPFLCRVVTNWMGDDGMLRELKWRKFANTTMGDTVMGRGRIVNKYVDENGLCLIEVDVAMENIRGFITNTGRIVVELPSREKDLWNRMPQTDNTPRLAIDTGLKVGDHIRIKPRGDSWKFPCEFPLAGETGVINELPVDLDGYIYVIMDRDCTSIDPAAQIGLRMTEVERI